LKKSIKYWQINIQDNGIGFEQEYAYKIFEVFQRLHGRSQYQGTGIGLAICKKIMGKHNGMVYVESELGKGACFILLFEI
jgi:light-regulated signal transduction histidine kinase (bacteriophytochrome)